MTTIFKRVITHILEGKHLPFLVLRAHGNQDIVKHHHDQQNSSGLGSIEQPRDVVENHCSVLVPVAVMVIRGQGGQGAKASAWLDQIRHLVVYLLITTIT